MKKTIFFLITILAISHVSAQEKFSVPKVTADQKIEVLYNHVIAYLVTGISFAKTQGVTPEDYGKFIGKKFTAYWNPDDSFQILVNKMMFILAGMHPDNQMQIVKQDEKSVTFKLKNVDFAFQNGPIFDVTSQDVLDCSHGIILELAEYMHSSFFQKMTNDGWYVVRFKKK